MDDSAKNKLLVEMLEFNQQLTMARLVRPRDPQKDAEALLSNLGAFGIIKAAISVENEQAIAEMARWIQKERNYHKSEVSS